FGRYGTVHSVKTGRTQLETELFVEAGFACDQVDIRRWRCVRFEPRDEFLHNTSAETATLMVGCDRDIDDLKNRSAVADDTTHPREVVVVTDRYRSTLVADARLGGR